jgi:hypothetical protein
MKTVYGLSVPSIEDVCGAKSSSLSAKTKTIIPFVVAAFLASWLAIAILVGDGASPCLWNPAEASVDWLHDSIRDCGVGTVHVKGVWRTGECWEFAA